MRISNTSLSLLVYMGMGMGRLFAKNRRDGRGHSKTKYCTGTRHKYMDSPAPFPIYTNRYAI